MQDRQTNLTSHHISSLATIHIAAYVFFHLLGSEVSLGRISVSRSRKYLETNNDGSGKFQIMVLRADCANQGHSPLTTLHPPTQQNQKKPTKNNTNLFIFLGRGYHLLLAISFPSRIFLFFLSERWNVMSSGHGAGESELSSVVSGAVLTHKGDEERRCGRRKPWIVRLKDPGLV
ncbi:uncharacterized protein K489DRAFT_72890 [Dissoconium aciculare CBS 342.82]|uniref:Uncharacterized protein n=1 Tax=Dissoconium aciculare CBS 342.82 TaxID=1314786 RepID=A0A6J3LTF5_9PEZI|nr:uncharacterized protein K489DRAFT_72890 [Dissoconium aciculare CBS 342.82]KAF1819060.1 hypothetical protein K489DRAFT_72890 [Dissoconium aciculare CBS 342.82]